MNGIPFSVIPLTSPDEVFDIAPKTESSTRTFHTSVAHPVGPSAFAPEPVLTTLFAVPLHIVALPLPIDATALAIPTVGIGLRESLPRVPPPATTPVPPLTSIPSAPYTYEEVLAIVATAMRDISLTQQKLAFKQDLPPVKFKKFLGAPDLLPLFCQRLQHHIMLREDLHDEYKMTCFLQFLNSLTRGK